MGTIWERRNKEEEERKKRQNERKDLTLTAFSWKGLSKFCAAFDL
jgi:hypothetical protein